MSMININEEDRKMLEDFYNDYLKFYLSKRYFTEEAISTLNNYFQNYNSYNIENVENIIADSGLLLFASIKNRADIIDVLLKYIPKDLHHIMINEDQCRPLAECVKRGNINIFKKLIDSESTIIEDFVFDQLFIEAARRGYLEILEELVKIRSHPFGDDTLEKAFTRAAEYGHLKILEELVKTRPHLFSDDILKRAFIIAAKNANSNLTVIAYLAYRINDISILNEIFSKIDIIKPINNTNNPKNFEYDPDVVFIYYLKVEENDILKIYKDNPQLLIDLGEKRHELTKEGLTHAQIDEAIFCAKSISSFVHSSKDSKYTLENIKGEFGSNIGQYAVDHILSYVTYDNANNSNLTDIQREQTYDLIRFNQNKTYSNKNNDSTCEATNNVIGQIKFLDRLKNKVQQDKKVWSR